MSSGVGTPYDRPRALLDRLLWPMLRQAWIEGYMAGRKAP